MSVVHSDEYQIWPEFSMELDSGLAQANAAHDLGGVTVPQIFHL